MMKRFIIVSLLVGMAMTLVALAQQPGPVSQAQMNSKYKPNENQQLRLQVKQKDAQLAQYELQAAQSKFGNALQELDAEGVKVEKENGWPDTVKMDRATLNFFETQAPKPAQVPAPEPAKNP